MLDASGSRLCIKTLRITANTFVKRRVDEDLEKCGGRCQLPDHPTFGAERRDERADHDQSSLGHQLCDLADAPNILDPVSHSTAGICCFSAARCSWPTVSACQ